MPWRLRLPSPRPLRNAKKRVAAMPHRHRPLSFLCISYRSHLSLEPNAPPLRLPPWSYLYSHAMRPPGAKWILCSGSHLASTFYSALVSFTRLPQKAKKCEALIGDISEFKTHVDQLIIAKISYECTKYPIAWHYIVNVNNIIGCV